MSANTDGFQVTGWVHKLGGWVERNPAFCIRLGDWESRILADRIAEKPIERPVFIAGLARAGSTILLETLAAHPEVATHRYRDYPGIFTPYWWNWWLDRVPDQAQTPVERTHQDGIHVTGDSPEAFEEIIWSAFVRGLHDPRQDNRVLEASQNPAFERFYRDHIRKLLAVRGCDRYVAKNNYNVTRLRYLHRLFPDARFVIPVRDPVWHVASLIKQQKLFEQGQREHPKSRAHLARVRHYEFGLDRRPINTGDKTRPECVARLWSEGREVDAWARYWALINQHLVDALVDDASLRQATLVVPFNALCQQPGAWLQRLLAHCALSDDDAFVRTRAGNIKPPDYYAPGFNDRELAVIDRETEQVARKLDGLTDDADVHQSR